MLLTCHTNEAQANYKIIPGKQQPNQFVHSIRILSSFQFKCMTADKRKVFQRLYSNSVQIPFILTTNYNAQMPSCCKRGSPWNSTCFLLKSDSWRIFRQIQRQEVLQSVGLQLLPPLATSWHFFKKCSTSEQWLKVSRWDFLERKLLIYWLENKYFSGLRYLAKSCNSSQCTVYTV